MPPPTLIVRTSVPLIADIVRRADSWLSFVGRAFGVGSRRVELKGDGCSRPSPQRAKRR